MACTQCGVERECDCPSGPPLVHERAAEEIADHYHRRDLRAGRVPDTRRRALSEALRLVEELEAAGFRVVEAAALGAVLDRCEWRVSAPRFSEPLEIAMCGCTWCDASVDGDENAPIPHVDGCPVAALRGGR